MTYIVLRLVAVASACLWLASGEQIAHATTTAANVDSTRLVRPGGTRYRYVEGSLNGTTARDDGSTGSYSVGFVLYYPTESGQVNGAGVVDYPNSVYYNVIIRSMVLQGASPRFRERSSPFSSRWRRPRTTSSKRATRTCPSSGTRL
ncbi:MAG: hypothetical protein QOH35_3776 [Acidobacteriaceae bacterium]|nr:hypothetical protein [Acidobacteriaceae bacterium]